MMMERIGSVEELEAQARHIRPGARPPAVNAHVHLPPNFSAFDRVEQAVDLAAEQGVQILGASNYYDFAAYEPFSRQAARRGVFPLWGLEILAMLPAEAESGVRINDPGNPGRVYVCGKGIARWQSPPAPAATLLARIRRGDARRMAEMVALLARCFSAAGIDAALDDGQIVAQVAGQCGCEPASVVLQERHVARAFQEALFRRVEPAVRPAALARLLGGAAPVDAADPAAVQAEIRRRLMKAGRSCFARERFVTFAEALTLIAQLGGIACYPVLGDGTDPVCPWEQPVDRLIGSLRSHGIPMAEFIPRRNDRRMLERYVSAMRQAGLAVVAGTEHNTPALWPLGLTCRDGAALPPAIEEIFVEGAHVVAAHQFLTAHGQRGLANRWDRPNGADEPPRRQIAALARLGAAVVARYRQMHEGSSRP